MPHYLRFLTKKSEHREQALREFNIEDFLVSQTWHENQIYYRIGIQGSDHYALIDPKTFFSNHFIVPFSVLTVRNGNWRSNSANLKNTTGRNTLK